MSDELLTTQEAAKRMGRSVKWVRYLITADRLPAQKFGPLYMIRAADVDNFEHKPRGKPPAVHAENGNSKKQPSKTSATKKRK
jgi:excisionase family DNA binding protein